MSTSSRPRVPIALQADSGHTEEGRASLQSRLTLFGGWVFLIAGGFLAFGLLMAVLPSDRRRSFTWSAP